MHVPLWVHVVAFVQLVFYHLVPADLQRRSGDVHAGQRHSEETGHRRQVFTPSFHELREDRDINLCDLVSWNRLHK